MEAAGLASSIITFIDFSYKLINGTIVVYQKASTGPADDPHITVVIKDLENVTELMTTTAAAASAASPAVDGQATTTAQVKPHQQELLALAGHCHELSKKLVAILEGLERKTDDKKLWRSFQTAWKTIRSSDQITEIEKKLNTYRLQMLLRLSLMLTDNDTSITEKLDQMHQGNIHSFGETISELRSVQGTIKELDTKLRVQAEQISRHIDEANQGHADDVLTDVQGQLSQITQKLETLHIRSPADLQILERLRFDSVDARVQAIVDGEFDVFSSLLAHSPPRESATPSPNDTRARDHASSLLDSWLEKGGEVLHISGKAGSGKSTLMKLLSHDSKMKERLRKWAGNAKLVISSFFFWLSGTTLQNSLAGLYRSILLEVLRQCPELTKHVFPEYWEEISTHQAVTTPKDFRLLELQDAMTRLVENFSGSSEYRFCFFIDGLDEFAGASLDHRNLAQQLRTWASSPDVKICASSRPHQEFHSTFEKNARIDLHELTSPDIYRFCREELEAESESQLRVDQVHILATTIESRASGVFLWARLVVRHLREGILHLDNYEKLEARLDQAPGDLMKLFLHLFNQINPGDRARAYRLLLLLRQWNLNPVNAMAVKWLDEMQTAEFPYNQPFVAYTEAEVARRVQYAERQLKLICKGLIEVAFTRPSKLSSSPVFYFQHSIRFFHRTVKDFLDQPDTVSAMQEHLSGHSNTSSDSLRVALAEIKFAPTSHEAVQYGSDLYWRFYHACKLSRETPRALDECESILRHHINEASSIPHCTRDNYQNDGATDWGRVLQHKPHSVLTWGTSSSDISYTHFLANLGASPDSVMDRVMARAYDTSSSSLCLVMSAIWDPYSSEPGLGLLKRLLNNGFDLSDRLALFDERDKLVQYVPGWVAFLALLGNECSMRRGKVTGVYFIRLYGALEHFVHRRTGPDLHVCLEYHQWSEAKRFEGQPRTERAPVRMALEELILFAAPPNMDIILREIVSRKTWIGWADHLARNVLRRVGLRGIDEKAPSRSTVSVLDVARAVFEAELFDGRGNDYNENCFAVRKVWVGDKVYELSTVPGIRLY